jgi:hypothetical protein
MERSVHDGPAVIPDVKCAFRWPECDDCEQLVCSHLTCYFWGCFTYVVKPLGWVFGGSGWGGLTVAGIDNRHALLTALT